MVCINSEGGGVQCWILALGGGRPCPGTAWAGILGGGNGAIFVKLLEISSFFLAHLRADTSFNTFQVQFQKDLR